MWISITWVTTPLSLDACTKLVITESTWQTPASQQHTHTIDCFRYVLRHPVIFLEACLLFRKNFNGRTTLLVMTPVKRDLPSWWARCTNRRSWHRSDGVGHLRAWGRDLGKWVRHVTRCQWVTSLVIHCTAVLWGGKLWGDAVSYCWVVRVY